MSSIKEFYDRLYKLSYITRYSVVPRIKDESVAEHSFYVASLVIKLHEYYEFNLGKATTMAIIHDWAEAWTDDITVATKKQFPLIEKAVRYAELEVANNKFSPVVLEHWSEHNKGTTVEAKIVHMADIMQCMQYASHEIKLGNSGYMCDVLKDANERLEKLEEELYEYKRCDK